MKIIAIAGGSGSGKTSISNEIVRLFPDKYEILSFDSFQKDKSDKGIERVDDYINWDHPNVILWSDLYKEISKNKRTKKEKILIVDGYLSLYSNKINELYDLKIFLVLDEKTRNIRRIKARGGKETRDGRVGYISKVLNPMHDKYVEPTKNYADETILISNSSVSFLAQHVIKLIKHYNIIK